MLIHSVTETSLSPKFISEKFVNKILYAFLVSLSIEAYVSQKAVSSNSPT